MPLVREFAAGILGKTWRSERVMDDLRGGIRRYLADEVVPLRRQLADFAISQPSELVKFQAGRLIYVLRRQLLAA